MSSPKWCCMFFVIALATLVLAGCSEPPPPPPEMVASATVDGTNTAVTGRSDCWKGDKGTYFLQALTYDNQGNVVDEPDIRVFLYKDSLSVKALSIAVSPTMAFNFDLPQNALTASKADNTYTIKGNL